MSVSGTFLHTTFSENFQKECWKKEEKTFDDIFIIVFSIATMVIAGMLIFSIIAAFALFYWDYERHKKRLAEIKAVDSIAVGVDVSDSMRAVGDDSTDEEDQIPGI